MRAWGFALLSLLLVAGSEDHWLGLCSDAVAAEQKKDHDRAQELWRAALVAAGKDELRTRVSEAGLGRALTRMSVFVEAIPHLERAAGLFRTAKPADEGGRLDNLEWLARSLVEARRRDDAVKPLEEALVVAVKLSGKRSARVGRILTALGRAHLERGRYAVAEPLLRKAYAIARETTPDDDAQILPSLRVLCRVLLLLGRYEELLARATEFGKRCSRSDRLPALRYQATALFRLGRMNDAGAAYGRLIALARARKNDDELARAHGGLGAVLRHAGEFREAEIHYRAAIRIRTRISGRHSVPLAGLWVGLGRVRLAQKRHDEAEDYVRLGIAVWQRAGLTNSRWLRSTLTTLAEIVEARGRTDEAEELRNRIRELEKRKNEAG